MGGHTQTLDRAFHLIDILAEAKEPLTLKEITDLANLPKPTIYRILSSLQEWSYVEQVDAGYKLGNKFLYLGNRVQEELEIRKIARPFLKKLNRDVNETVFLGVLDGNKGLYLDKLESTHSVRLVSRIGSRNYLHCTGLGKSLLMGFSEVKFKELLSSQGMPQMTENTITDFTKLWEEIATGQQNGYVLDNMENEEGVRCVAAPIRNYKGNVIAAVSISGPIHRITDQMLDKILIPALLKTSKDISRALGYK